jgi:hypothetical protein
LVVEDPSQPDFISDHQKLWEDVHQELIQDVGAHRPDVLDVFFVITSPADPSKPNAWKESDSLTFMPIGGRPGSPCYSWPYGDHASVYLDSRLGADNPGVSRWPSLAHELVHALINLARDQQSGVQNYFPRVGMASDLSVSRFRRIGSGEASGVGACAKKDTGLTWRDAMRTYRACDGSAPLLDPGSCLLHPCSGGVCPVAPP